MIILSQKRCKLISRVHGSRSVTHAIRIATGIDRRKRRARENTARARASAELRRAADEQEVRFAIPLGAATPSEMLKLANGIGQLEEEGVPHRITFSFGWAPDRESYAWVGDVRNPKYERAHEEYEVAVRPIKEALREELEPAKRREYEKACEIYRVKHSKWAERDASTFEASPCPECFGSGWLGVSYEIPSMGEPCNCGSGWITSEEAKRRAEPAEPQWSCWQRKLDQETAAEANRLAGERLMAGELQLPGWEYRRTFDGYHLRCTVPEIVNMYARAERIESGKG